jgi:hypothetical protein
MIMIDGAGDYFAMQKVDKGMTFKPQGAEAMRIDSSGNVGIATTSPDEKLDVAGNVVVNNGGFYKFGDGTVRIYGETSSDIMTFVTNDSERMRIDSSGIVTIGTTASGASSSLRCFSTPTNANVGVARFEATGEAAATTAMSVVKSVNDNSTSNVFVRFGINAYAGGSGQINANGSSQAAFGSFSDRRLKENITDLPSQLDKLKAMRPVEFDYIESEGGGHQLGFIAQEIEEIYPDMVGEREDGMKTLSGLGKWEARLVKAIQEQQEQIEALQSEINTLKGG